MAWTAAPNHVYIGRAMPYQNLPQSKWANPYSVKTYGRDEALRLYRLHLATSGLLSGIGELRGKKLGCWCAPEPCHGDILAALANAS